jgi:hypothetical protein
MYLNLRIRVPLFLGKFFLWLYRVYQKIRYGQSIRFIPLNNGRFAIVDSADYEKLTRYNWSVRTSSEYAMRIEKGKNIYMHNEIIHPQSGLVVDHKNHNGLNNTRENLRIATKSQNCCNQKKRLGSSSKYKGVYLNKCLGKWGAVIRFQRKYTFLGYFTNEIDAAKAYDEAAKKYHGEFAVLNFGDKSDMPKNLPAALFGYFKSS